MEQKEPDKTSGKNSAGNGLPGFNMSLFRAFIWASLLSVVLFYFMGKFTSDTVAVLAYSDFINLIRQHDIKEIVMKGSAVTGTFEKPYPTVSSDGKHVMVSSFSTVLTPVDDPALLGLLEANGVKVRAEQAGGNWLGSLLIIMVPWLLIMGYFLWASRRIQAQMGGSPMNGLFGVGRSRAKRFKGEITSVNYRDVAGLSNAKTDLHEIVSFLKDPGKFAKLGATVPKGILLMGPPGTGKTLLARATAGEAGVPFFSTSGSEFIEMFVGVGASRVRDLFETAKREAPAIIFIDELDSVGRARGTGVGGSHDEREQTLNQILSEMDGFEPHESVVVMAATNRPDVLDPALTRPGRFDRQITMELPQKKARLDILITHSRRIPLAPEVSLETIAARTVGFSGADLRNLVNEAALLAGRKDKKVVDAEDFEMAQDKIVLGDTREDKLDEKERMVVAFHEAGHALIAKLLPETDPLKKVTIIARGRALGATEQIPDIDRHNFDRHYLLARLCVALGGRASEKLIYNNLTNGAAEDLKIVTNLARKMVCQWGMSDRLGPTFFTLGEEHPFLGRELAQPREFSEFTARIIDEEIQRIIFEQEERATNLLSANRMKLETLAMALMEHETLENGEIDQILESPRIGPAPIDIEHRKAA